MKLRYVMITHLDDHWDKIDESYYPENMIHVEKEKIRNFTPTIFIKINKQTKKLEKAWEGYIYDIRDKKDEKGRINFKFRIKINNEILIPKKYRKYKEGWYAEEIEDRLWFEAIYYPPFFYILNTTSDYNEFEKYVFMLLKLLGIHQIFRYEKQRGHPDGFFRFGNLAVIYDATLENAFEKSKKIQIENYCNLLKRGTLTYKTITLDVSSCEKQVWIITRGNSRILKKRDGVIVKEVSTSEIIRIYLKRLEENISKREFEIMLKKIGET